MGLRSGASALAEVRDHCRWWGPVVGAVLLVLLLKVQLDLIPLLLSPIPEDEGPGWLKQTETRY